MSGQTAENESMAANGFLYVAVRSHAFDQVFVSGLILHNQR